MSAWFHLNAARQLLKRRRGPFVRMVAVAIVGALWCVVGGMWTLATFRDIDRQCAEVRVDLFVRTEVSDSVARIVAHGIAELPSVDHARLIRENEVWREFSGDVGADEELRTVVTMPRLIRFAPKVDDATTQRILLMTAGILSEYGDVIHDVVWPREYMQALDARRRDLLVLSSAAGILSLVMFLLALSYAFRAELHAAGADLRVGALLGASPTWIAMPHLMVSVLAGATGLIVALAIIAAFAREMIERLPWLNLVRPDEIGWMAGGLAALGLFVGLWQSQHAARQAIRRKESS